MVADNELQLDMQCRERLHVLNNIVSNDPIYQDQGITNDMIDKEADNKVVANAKSVEHLSRMPLPELSKINETVNLSAAKSSSNPQSASNSTTVVSSLAMKSNL